MNPSTRAMIVCGWLLANGVTAANATERVPVARTTSDRDADLLAKLDQLGRHDDAIAICRNGLRDAARESDESARWAIRWSRMLTARQMAAPQFEPPQVEAAQRPVTEQLEAYPDHPRRLFLQAQLLAVRRDAARHDVVTLAVSPTGNTRLQPALQRLTRTTTDTLALARDTEQSRASLIDQRGAATQALIADLIRLEQQLRLDAVSLSLLQTELFPAGSRDRLAAATHAGAAAEEAASRLPADSPARREVERLRIEALLRGDQVDNASRELASHAMGLPKPIPASVQAMQVRVELLRHNRAAARDRLAAYFGSDPESAPLSAEMDLARLDYLLTGDSGDGQIAGWLDAIGRRGGLYARRRAEAVSLARLRGASTSTSVDPALVVAQGEDWLRRGDASRAGELFAAAAEAESNDNRALRYAMQSAAALLKAAQPREASAVLARTATAHRDAQQASAAHLQSAVLYHSTKLPDSADVIEKRLVQHLATWPQGEQASPARDWLIRIRRGQGRLAEAAEAATNLPPEKLLASELERAVGLWRDAFQATTRQQEPDVAKRYRDSFLPLQESVAGRIAFRHSASYLIDRALLSNLPPSEGDSESTEATACEQLLAFRLGGGGSLDPPPTPLRDVFVWRLMRDGRQQATMRIAIANAIGSWDESASPDPSVGQAERLIWQGNVSEAEQMVRDLIRDDPDGGAMLRRAAELMGQSDDADAKKIAIRLWDELAGGMRQGGAAWHQAKLASIGLLRSTGQGEEAIRRARYVLLTSPPKDRALKRQYEAASRP